MKGRSIVLLEAWALLGIYSAQEKIHLACPKGELVLEDLSFVAAETPDSNLVRINGTFHNLTGVRLSEVNLGVHFAFISTLFGKNLIQTCNFVIKDLGPGVTELQVESPSSCASFLRTTKIIKFDVELASVTPKPIILRSRITFRLAKPGPSVGCSWEDSILKIVFDPTTKGIGFDLKNKTEAPIKLDWNNVSFVDFEGDAHRVIHADIRYIERDRTHPPTIIPPSVKISDLVYPADLIYWSSITESWTKIDLWPIERTITGFDAAAQRPSVEAELKALEKKTISVFLPLEINGIKKYYNFILKPNIEIVAR